MIKSQSKLFLLIGSMVLLTSCATDQVSNLQDKASQVQDIAAKADQAKNVLANAGPLKEKVLGMKTGVSDTLTAVKSGDFSTAQTNFGTLQQSWNDIQGDLKNISADGHDALQTGMTTVDTELKAEKPDGDKIAQNLQEINDSITTMTGTGTVADTMDKSTTEAQSEASAPKSKSVGGGELDNSESLASNLSAMKIALAETKTALESSDFSGAKTSFADARQSWFKFGGSIKQSSVDTYQSIDSEVKTINTALNSETPAQETLLSELGSLSDSVNQVVP